MARIIHIDKTVIVDYVKTILIQDVDSALDIGCGIRPQNYVTAKKHLYIEPFDEYVSQLKNIISPDSVIMQGTWEEKINDIPDNSVDTILIIDVIEHLPKKKGSELLKLTDKKAIKQIVVMTPYGFVKQTHPDGRDAWGFGGGAWQEHKSGWMPEDFDDTWMCCVSPDFHTRDNYGKLYPKPKGIIYAIKTK